jgi:hypothetical protein
LLNDQSSTQSISPKERPNLSGDAKSVATMTKPGSIAVGCDRRKWNKNWGIRCSQCVLPLLNRAKASLVARFVRAVRRHAKRRLASILEFTQALFRFVMTDIRIIGANSNGSYLGADIFFENVLGWQQRRSGFEERRTNPKQNLGE